MASAPIAGTTVFACGQAVRDTYSHPASTLPNAHSWFGEREWIYKPSPQHQLAAAVIQTSDASPGQLPDGSSFVQDRPAVSPSSGPSASQQRQQPFPPLQQAADTSVPSADGVFRFSVMCYNILGDCYAQHYVQRLYSAVPRFALKWSHRRPLLAKEILHWAPDVVTLQEVEHYADIEQDLNAGGYEGVFLRRSGTRHDGCATFWKSSRFRLLASHPIKFSKMSLDDNVVLIVELQPLVSPARHAPMSPTAAAATAAATHPALGDVPPTSTDATLVSSDVSPAVQPSSATAPALHLPHVLVSNTHLIFDPTKGDVKVGQIRTLMTAMATLMEHGVLTAPLAPAAARWGRQSSSGRVSMSGGTSSTSRPPSFGRMSAPSGTGATGWASSSYGGEVGDGRSSGDGGGSGRLQPVPEALFVLSGEANSQIARSSSAEVGNSARSSLGPELPRPAGVVAIVTGDFNTMPDSPLYRFCLDGRLDLLQHSKKKISGQVCAAAKPKPATVHHRGTPSRMLQNAWHRSASLPAHHGLDAAFSSCAGLRAEAPAAAVSADRRVSPGAASAAPQHEVTEAAAAMQVDGTTAVRLPSSSTSPVDVPRRHHHESAVPHDVPLRQESSTSEPAQSWFYDAAAATTTACSSSLDSGNFAFPMSMTTAAAAWPTTLISASSDGSACHSRNLDDQVDAAFVVSTGASDGGVVAVAAGDDVVEVVVVDRRQTGCDVVAELVSADAAEVAACVSAASATAAAAAAADGDDNAGDHGLVVTTTSTAAMATAKKRCSFDDTSLRAKESPRAVASASGRVSGILRHSTEGSGATASATATVGEQQLQQPPLSQQRPPRESLRVSYSKSVIFRPGPPRPLSLPSPRPAGAPAVEATPSPCVHSGRPGQLLPQGTSPGASALGCAYGMLDALLRSVQSKMSLVDGTGWTRRHLRLAMGEQALEAASTCADGADAQPPCRPVELVASHPLKLASSYASVTGEEPPFTSSHSAFHNTCDYIFYTPDATCSSISTSHGGHNDADPATTPAGQGPPCLGPCASGQLTPVMVLAPPATEALPQGLPAPFWGSDHIALVTTFELRPTHAGHHPRGEVA